MTKLNALARAGVSGLALLAGFAAASVPASAGDIRGRVSDEISNSALPGAVVSIEGSSVSVTANRDGSFLFANVKPGSYTLRVDYVGYPDKSVTVSVGEGLATVAIALGREESLESVTVTGQRQAERVALQVKRTADSIIETLYSNDVGKLPDQNVAEAVRRLPGISITTDQGEGRYVIIRGAAPNLTNVTVNGQTAPAPEPDSRQVKLDDIPASLVGSLTVVKSLTPDLDANAIAGQLDISTLSAFDRNGPFAYGRFSAGHYAMNGRTPFEGDLTAGTVFGGNDQFGIVASANYSKRPIQSWNFGAGGPSWNTVSGTAGTAVLPSTLQLRDYNLFRIRGGAVLNFDWKVNEHLELFSRNTYSSFSDNETRDRFTFNVPTSAASYSALGTTTGTFTTGGSANRYVRSREEDDHTWNFSLGGKYTEGVNLLKIQGTFSEAIKTDPRRDEWTFKTSASTISGTYDLSDPVYLVTPDASAYDASKYVFSGISHANREAAENLYQLRADYERVIDGLGDGATLKAGFKWTERDKKNTQWQQSFKANKGTPAASLTLTSFAYDGLGAGRGDYVYDDRYLVGPRIDYKAAEAYFLTAHGTRDCDTSTGGGFYCDVAGSISASNSANYRVREDVVAGYVMANLKFGNLELVPGVRVEDTDGSYGATIVKLAGSTPVLTPSVTNKRYTDIFPGLNAKYTLAEDLILRGAITTAIGRPDYNNLPPYVVVDTTANTVSMGNPDLKPLHSRNFDLSAEYYLPGQGVIALSAFYKDIDDPIFTMQRVDATGGTYGGVGTTGATTVSGFANASSGKIKGVEINLSDQFTFLPSPLDGLGASANLAVIDSSATGTPGRTDTLPMFNQSKYVGTAQVFYEKYGVTARLAYSYRSKYLLTVGSNTANDVYVGQYGTLDARVGYDISSRLSVYFEAANINSAAYRTYIGTASHLYENEKYSYSTKLGVQVKL